MVRSKREYIFATCFLSGIGAALNLAALGTEQWVTSDLEVTENDPLSKVHYGLFYGVYEQNAGGISTFQLQTTCLFSENICAMMCEATNEERVAKLEQLYNGEDAVFTNCLMVSRLYPARNSEKSSIIKSTSNQEFLNAGIWLSSIIFLIISAIFGVVSAGLSVWNTVANPVEAFFNVFGLYIYNSVAAVTSLLVVILYGSMFGTVIVDDIVMFYTVAGQADSKGLASLGYSYWINLVAVLLYAASVGVLYIRQYKINHDSTKMRSIERDDTSDPNIYLY